MYVFCNISYDVPGTPAKRLSAHATNWAGRTSQGFTRLFIGIWMVRHPSTVSWKQILKTCYVTASGSVHSAFRQDLAAHTETVKQ